MALGYITFYMLNSAEHKMFSANKCENDIFIHTFISKEKCMLSYVQQERICSC